MPARHDMPNALSEAERDRVYSHLGEEARRRRASYRKDHPFTAADFVNHIMRGQFGHITYGEAALALQEHGFEVEWDTVLDDSTPFVVTLGVESVLVEPIEHFHSKILRWQAES